MPRRNRVDPFGRLHAVSDHGDLMGNRGCLHDVHGNIVRKFKGKGWVSCTTRWPGIRRPLMAPGKYTELFFRDEATAFAAGHVPCSQCRAPDARLFRHLWNAARGLPDEARAGDVHAMLHEERTAPPLLYDPNSTICDGVLVGRADESRVWLRWSGTWLLWSFAGYSMGDAPEGAAVVLTPLSIIEIIRRGYPVAVHESATKVAASALAAPHHNA